MMTTDDITTVTMTPPPKSSEARTPLSEWRDQQLALQTQLLQALIGKVESFGIALESLVLDVGDLRDFVKPPARAKHTHPTGAEHGD